jgi:hypothetical protein
MTISTGVTVSCPTTWSSGSAQSGCPLTMGVGQRNAGTAGKA